MALSPCPECAWEISSSVVQCPHCGYPFRTSRTVWPNLWLRPANRTDNAFAFMVLGFAVAYLFVSYLFVYCAGLANARTGGLAALLVLGVPTVPVVLVGVVFHIYGTASVSALVTIVLFLLMVVGLLGPYRFGEYAGSADGAGLGLGGGLVFVWQWGIVLVLLVAVAIGSVIERNAFLSRERRGRHWP